MGDRANVYVKNTEDKGVYLYTHWAGTELPQLVQAALKREQRWDDDSYLTRIIFDELTDGQHGEETGFGISACMGDNQSGRPVIYLDPRAGKIGFASEPEDGKPPAAPAEMMTFAEFIALPKAKWPGDEDDD